MQTISFSEALAGCAAFGFITGWICGMFLGMWAWVTLVWR